MARKGGRSKEPLNPLDMARMLAARRRTAPMGVSRTWAALGKATLIGFGRRKGAEVGEGALTPRSRRATSLSCRDARLRKRSDRRETSADRIVATQVWGRHGNFLMSILGKDRRLCSDPERGRLGEIVYRLGHRPGRAESGRDGDPRRDDRPLSSGCAGGAVQPRSVRPAGSRRS